MDNYFPTNISWQMFDRVLNMPLWSQGKSAPVATFVQGLHSFRYIFVLFGKEMF